MLVDYTQYIMEPEMMIGGRAMYWYGKITERYKKKKKKGKKKVKWKSKYNIVPFVVLLKKLEIVTIYP